VNLNDTPAGRSLGVVLLREPAEKRPKGDALKSAFLAQVRGMYLPLLSRRQQEDFVSQSVESGASGGA